MSKKVKHVVPAEEGSEELLSVHHIKQRDSVSRNLGCGKRVRETFREKALSSQMQKL